MVDLFASWLLSSCGFPSSCLWFVGNGRTVILVIRGEALTAAALRTADAWFFEVDHSLAAAIELLYDAAVRSAVRRDRTAYLEFLAAKVASGDMRAPKQLYASVRRAFPLAKSARRQSFHPLPAVKLADGTPALTVQQRIDGWVDHFVQQEGGVRVDDAEYVEAFHSPPIPVRGQDSVFSLAALPTMHQLEQQLLRAKLGNCTPFLHSLLTKGKFFPEALSRGSSGIQAQWASAPSRT